MMWTCFCSHYLISYTVVWTALTSCQQIERRRFRFAQLVKPDAKRFSSTLTENDQINFFFAIHDFAKFCKNKICTPKRHNTCNFPFMHWYHKPYWNAEMTKNFCIDSRTDNQNCQIKISIKIQTVLKKVRKSQTDHMPIVCDISIRLL